MMFCQKEEIDHELGNHKGARNDFVSTFLFTLNELQGRMLNRLSLSEYNNVHFSQEASVFCFLTLL